MWMGGSVVIRPTVWLATTKDIGKKGIMIGRDCGFFVVASFELIRFHLWEMIGIVVYCARVEA